MKKLTIAGNVGKDSKIVNVNDKEYSEFYLAINKTSGETDWIKVMADPRLSFKTGAVVTATGNIDISAYINKDGNPGINQTLYPDYLKILFSPKLDTVEAEDSNIDSIEHTKQPIVEEAKVLSKLEEALEKIDNAKTEKQLNYFYYNLVNLLEGNDQKVALDRLNERKKSLRLENKAA